MKRFPLMLVPVLVLGPILSGSCAKAGFGPRDGGDLGGANDGGHQLVAELRSGSDLPTATLELGPSRQDGTMGSVCWSGDGAAQCIDMAPDVFVPQEYVDVPRGSTIRVTGDAREVSGLVATIDRSQGYPTLSEVARLRFADGVASLDVPAGEYTLELTGSWEQGDAPFYFGVRVV